MILATSDMNARRGTCYDGRYMRKPEKRSLRTARIAAIDWGWNRLSLARSLIKHQRHIEKEFARKEEGESVDYIYICLDPPGRPPGTLGSIPNSLDWESVVEQLVDLIL